MVVADTRTGAPTAADSAASASSRRGADLRSVADDLHGDVADGVAGLAHQAGGLGQQGGTGGAGPLRLGRAEPGSEVAESRGGQQCVAGGVRGDVAVGVSFEALGLVRPGQSGQLQRDAVDESMDVGADPDQRRKKSVMHILMMPESQS